MHQYDRPVYAIEDGSHFLEWEPTPMERIRKQVVGAIANDRDGKIRQALIDLGWTPPKD